MINPERTRLWTSRLLLGFVLVTIGFAAGRRTAPAPPADTTAAEPSNVERADQLDGQDKVIVYAAHMTFRCPECTQIEWLARELIETDFADELADGILEFRTVDYMRDSALVRHSDIHQPLPAGNQHRRHQLYLAQGREDARGATVWTLVRRRPNCRLSGAWNVDYGRPSGQRRNRALSTKIPQPGPRSDTYPGRNAAFGFARLNSISHSGKIGSAGARNERRHRLGGAAWRFVCLVVLPRFRRTILRHSDPFVRS